jgi:hypothetical protein
MSAELASLRTWLENAASMAMTLDTSRKSTLSLLMSRINLQAAAGKGLSVSRLILCAWVAKKAPKRFIGGEKEKL